MKMVPRLTMADAQHIMQACLAKARELAVDMDIAITDDAGHLIMFQRMDNARITSIDIAISKSFTAAAARKSTRAYGEISVPGKPAFGINTSNQGRFSIVAGGLPLFMQEFIVGGVGCSSGTPDQDEIVAQAGVNAFTAYIS
ncbi:glc operon protein GlcG [Pseudomonas sp. IT-196MI5]|uniref:GlcG/HbpS family heme-binding protein n=2 Tax=unclassified Pseudomonas TaxID=196821 RepID=UPI0039E17011